MLERSAKENLSPGSNPLLESAKSGQWHPPCVEREVAPDVALMSGQFSVSILLGDRKLVREFPHTFTNLGPHGKDPGVQVMVPRMDRNHPRYPISHANAWLQCGPALRQCRALQLSRLIAGWGRRPTALKARGHTQSVLAFLPALDDGFRFLQDRQCLPAAGACSVTSWASARLRHPLERSLALS